MKNSYFFHISLNIGRSDMKQTPKNSVRSMLSYPFTLFWILTHTFFFFFWCYHFFFFLMLPLCLTSLLIRLHHTPRSIHQGPYTHTPSYFRGFKCPYTCLFLYRKKLQMSTFLVYLYKKKPLRASRGPYTSVHLNTKFAHQILCSNSVLPVLSLPSSLDHYFLSIFHLAYLIQCVQRAALSYPVCTARCAILSSVHSALRYIIQCAQRIALYYPAFFGNFFFLLIK